MNIKSFGSFKILILLLFLHITKTNSQDIINPYVLRDGVQNVIQSINLTPKEPISTFEFETVIPQVSNSSGYDGKYDFFEVSPLAWFQYLKLKFILWL